MRYVGGKSKLAKRIAETILDTVTERDTYLEPFIGGGAVFGRLAHHFDSAHVSDLHPDLAAMWEGLLHEGFIPPEQVSAMQYAALRDGPVSPLRGFVGFGGSFGGKWFGGYAKGGFGADGAPRNHQAESARALIRVASKVDPNRVTVNHGDYSRWSPLAGDVVYCDPPYAETQGYSVDAFDSMRFWRTIDRWCVTGAHVFVSEYACPLQGWETVLEAPHRQSLVTVAQGRPETIERLFYRAPGKA